MRGEWNVGTQRDTSKGSCGFEILLDQAAGAVLQGADPAAVASQYGEAEGRLRPLLEVVARLQVLREPPPPASLAAGRARFLARARDLRARRVARRSHGSPGIVAWPWPRLGDALLRPAMSLVLVVLLFSLVGYTAQAASASLPGSPLYPVKLAVERTQVALAADQEVEAHLEVAFATRRLDEIHRLAEAGHPPDPGCLRRLERQWETTLRAIASLRTDRKALLLAQALGSLSYERESLRRLMERASPEVRERLQLALFLTEEMELTVRKALARPDEFRGPQGRPPAVSQPAPPAALPETPTPSQALAEPIPSPTPEPPTPMPTPPQVPRPQPSPTPPVPSPTPEPPTATPKPTKPPKPTHTPTATPAPTSTPEPATPMPTETPTPEPATPPPTPTASRTPEPFEPPPPVLTPPTPTPTCTPTATPTDALPEPTSTLTATAEPPTPEPTPTAGYTPQPFEPPPPTLTPRPPKPPPPILPPPPVSE